MQWVEWVSTSKKGNPFHHRSLKIVLTPEQEEWLKQWYPTVENSRLMKASGLKHSALHRFARDLHLTKSKKGWNAIKRRQARHIKRVCEKNGYYDSLRGKPMSEACKEGTRRMWQEIREGKREHPARIMARVHPRKYKQWMQRKSAERREAIRREVMRMKWGLPRKTRLRVAVMNPYSRNQVNRRYLAQRRGYIIADDCSEESGNRYVIFYDENTTRSELFEKNSIKDGFRIERWCD